MRLLSQLVRGTVSQLSNLEELCFWGGRENGGRVKTATGRRDPLPLSLLLPFQNWEPACKRGAQEGTPLDPCGLARFSLSRLGPDVILRQEGFSSKMKIKKLHPLRVVVVETTHSPHSHDTLPPQDVGTQTGISLGGAGETTSSPWNVTPNGTGHGAVYARRGTTSTKLVGCVDSVRFQ